MTRRKRARVEAAERQSKTCGRVGKRVGVVGRGRSGIVTTAFGTGRSRLTVLKTSDNSVLIASESVRMCRVEETDKGDGRIG